MEALATPSSWLPMAVAGPAALYQGLPPPTLRGLLGPSPALQGSEGAGRRGGRRRVQGLAQGRYWQCPRGALPPQVPAWPRGTLTAPHPPAQCSAACGDGVQRRLVRCVNTQTGLPEEDSERCGHEAWPESSRPCGAQDCELTEAPRESAAPCAGSGWGGPGDGILSGPQRTVRLRARAKGPQPRGRPASTSL